MIRLINAAIKQREVDERIELDDAQVLAVLEKMVKQRRDSITQYDAAGRDDLAAVERFELGVIEAYLPAADGAERARRRGRRRHRRNRRRRPARHGQGDGACSSRRSPAGPTWARSRLVKRRLAGGETQRACNASPDRRRRVAS